MLRRHSLAALVLLLVLVVPQRVVSADAGPKPTLTLRLQWPNTAPADTDVQVRLLVCDLDDLRPPADDPLPLFGRADLIDPAGCVWRERSMGIYGGLRDDAWVFSGMLPNRFRVAVYVPASGDLYLSDIAERQSMHERYVAELAVDGSGHLRADALPVIGRSFSWQGMLLGLILTLAVELAVVLVYARITQRPMRRLLLVATIANVISLPAVWLLAGLGYVVAGVEAGLIVMAVLEGLAWLAEAAAYLGFGKLKIEQAALLSLIANLCSLLLGLMVH